jgi:hypothetical protein
MLLQGVLEQVLPADPETIQEDSVCGTSVAACLHATYAAQLGSMTSVKPQCSGYARLSTVSLRLHWIRDPRCSFAAIR